MDIVLAGRRAAAQSAPVAAEGQPLHSFNSMTPGSSEVSLDAGKYRLEASTVSDGRVERLTQLGEELATHLSARANDRLAAVTGELGLANRLALAERLGIVTDGNAPQVTDAAGNMLAAPGDTFELTAPATVTVSFGDAPAVLEIWKETSNG